MTTTTSRWDRFVDVCARLHRHPTSFARKLRELKKDGYLKQGKHYLQTGDTPNSPILWDIAELEKFFASSQPRRIEK